MMIRSIVGRMLLIAAMALLMVSCTSRASAPVPPAAQDPGAHAEHAAHTSLEAAAPSGLSLYQLESEWQDQHGATRQLADLPGPQAIAMVYTHCGSACPRIVMDMKRLEAEYPALKLTLVSIDPERDTPGRLLEFAEGSRLDESWTLLNGSEDDLLELAAVLGVKYRRISEEDFMHSNIITILDEQGVIVHRQQALGEVEGTLAALSKIFAE